MYSFDVFDTIITRKTLTPEGVFALMQKKLLCGDNDAGIPDTVRKNYANIRSGAERMARLTWQQDGIEDITFDQVYDIISHRGDLSINQIVFLKQMERDMEYECSVGIEANIKRIHKLIEEGNKVVLISDMYFDSNMIRRLVTKADPKLEDIPIYVSSESGKSKYTGNLFWYVKDKEKCEFGDWTHIGDNPESDERRPKELGIRTELFKYEQYTPLESFLIDDLKYSAKFQLMAGCARNTRLKNHCGKEAGFGISLLGPVLYDYAEWIVDNAISTGINRLYFIARDGYTLKLIADEIIKHRKANIKTEYIYGSRLSWRLPSVTTDNWDVDKYISVSFFNYVTDIADIADAFNLTEEELKDFLRGVSGKQDHDRRTVMRYIRTEQFRDFIIDKNREKRELAIEYFKETIDVKDDDFAFVELLGTGYSQCCLAELMTDLYDKPIKTYFFLMGLLEETQKSRCICYLPGRRSWYVCLEGLNRAPHGQTTGYRKDGKSVVPELDTVEDKLFADHNIDSYLTGVGLFASEFASYREDFGYVGDDLNVLESYMSYVEKQPDRELLDFLGDMPFGRTGRKNETSVFAPVLTTKDIIKIFLLGLGNTTGEYYKGTSLEHSVMRCNNKQMRLVDFCKKHNQDAIGYVCRKIMGINSVSQMRYPVPAKMLGKRVVIYAAGNVGKAYFDQLRYDRKHTVVLWVDKKWDELSRLGLPVMSPESLKTTDYDTLLIAVESDRIAQDIKSELIMLGVSEDKIVY